MHSLNIVHRDIKIQNIVYLGSIDNKNCGHIKIIDFGTAV